MWSFLKSVLEPVGNFQSRLILTLVYIFVVPLFAFIARMSDDALGLRQYGSQSASFWRQRRTADLDVDSARKQS